MAALVSITAAMPSATAPRWTADPRAAALLASCAKNPPVGEYLHTHYVRSQECHFVYTGRRAAQLEAIRKEYAEKALDASWGGDDAAWDAFQAQPTVTAAIDAAPLALIYAEAAADLCTSLAAIAAAPFMAEAA